MSEIIQPAMPEEQNTASTLEQAINAATQEEVVTEATSTEPTTDAPAQITRKEIIERLKEIAGSDDALNYKSETDALKIQFYKLRSIEAEAARKAEDEESESPATPGADELEEQFKEVMNIIKESATHGFNSRQQSSRPTTRPSSPSSKSLKRW